MEYRYWILFQLISTAVVPFYGFFYFVLTRNFKQIIYEPLQTATNLQKRKNLDPCNMAFGPFYNKAHVFQLL
jgi:hypothetical protein